LLGGISKYSMIQGIGEMGKPAPGDVGGCAFWMCAIANQALPPSGGFFML